LNLKLKVEFIMKNLMRLVILSGVVLFTSCGKTKSGSNLSIPGVNGPKVTLLQDDVLISMSIQSIQLDGGARVSIPKYPNSYIEISPDVASGGTLFAANIAMKDVLGRNAQEFDAMTLPGGRALPGVLGGSLPAVAFTIPKFHNISIYLGPKIFGLFVPVKINIGQNIISARYYIGKSRAGNLSIVGPDTEGKNSGVLLLLDMDAQTKNQMAAIVAKHN
jgi:hypothetical protein